MRNINILLFDDATRASIPEGLKLNQQVDQLLLNIVALQANRRS
jgi:hypothetical protein